MYNHTGLQGRLTADPELRYTQQGTAITSFTLASDTGRKTKDGKKITNFIECVAWRAQAEFVCKYLSKGRLVLVEGELTSRNYPATKYRRRLASSSSCTASSRKCSERRMPMIPLPDKKYSIIYADPPWSYQNRGTRAAASKHYDTMTIEDIKRMGVGAAGGGVLLTRIACFSCGRPSPCSARPST